MHSYLLSRFLCDYCVSHEMTNCAIATVGNEKQLKMTGVPTGVVFPSVTSIIGLHVHWFCSKRNLYTEVLSWLYSLISLSVPQIANVMVSRKVEPPSSLRRRLHLRSGPDGLHFDCAFLLFLLLFLVPLISPLCSRARPVPVIYPAATVLCSLLASNMETYQLSGVGIEWTCERVCSSNCLL